MSARRRSSTKLTSESEIMSAEDRGSRRRSKRMSTSDVHRSGTADVTSSEHAPLWAVGLSILLIALGFAGRRSGNASTATGDRKPLEAGRGRSAETPSQIPVRGWKDILLRVYHLPGRRLSLGGVRGHRITRGAIPIDRGDECTRRRVNVGEVIYSLLVDNIVRSGPVRPEVMKIGAHCTRLPSRSCRARSSW